MPEIERIGNVYYKSTDMTASVDFYTRILGLSLKFRDGDNWAAFDVGGMTLAVEPTAEILGGASGATVSLRVRDLGGFVALIRARGAHVGDVTTGAHERRADVTDPSGNRLVLYEPLPRP